MEKTVSGHPNLLRRLRYTHGTGLVSFCDE